MQKETRIKRKSGKTGKGNVLENLLSQLYGKPGIIIASVLGTFALSFWYFFGRKSVKPSKPKSHQKKFETLLKELGGVESEQSDDAEEEEEEWEEEQRPHIVGKSKKHMNGEKEHSSKTKGKKLDKNQENQRNLTNGSASKEATVSSPTNSKATKKSNSEEVEIENADKNNNDLDDHRDIEEDILKTEDPEELLDSVLSSSLKDPTRNSSFLPDILGENGEKKRSKIKKTFPSDMEAELEAAAAAEAAVDEPIIEDADSLEDELKGLSVGHEDAEDLLRAKYEKYMTSFASQELGPVKAMTDEEVEQLKQSTKAGNFQLFVHPDLRIAFQVPKDVQVMLQPMAEFLTKLVLVRNKKEHVMSIIVYSSEAGGEDGNMTYEDFIDRNIEETQALYKHMKFPPARVQSLTLGLRPYKATRLESMEPRTKAPLITYLTFEEFGVIFQPNVLGEASASGREAEDLKEKQVIWSMVMQSYVVLPPKFTDCVVFKSPKGFQIALPHELFVVSPEEMEQQQRSQGFDVEILLCALSSRQEKVEEFIVRRLPEPIAIKEGSSVEEVKLPFLNSPTRIQCYRFKGMNVVECAIPMPASVGGGHIHLCLTTPFDTTCEILSRTLKTLTFLPPKEAVRKPTMTFNNTFFRVKLDLPCDYHAKASSSSTGAFMGRIVNAKSEAALNKCGRELCSTQVPGYG